MQRITLLAGTWENNPEWIENPAHPFQVMLQSQGFQTARSTAGTPFRWLTKVGGLPLVNRGIWEDTALDLLSFCEGFPYRDLNFLGFSHGGQPAIIAIGKLAEKGVRVRSLVTVGTPVRADVPARQAAGNVDCWLHIIDRDFDRMALHRKMLHRTLAGQIFDGSLSQERRFLLPGVENILVPGIGHGHVLHDAELIPLWISEGWMETLRKCTWRDQT